MHTKDTARSRVLISVTDAAARMALSPRTVWAMISAGRLTPYRFGTRATRVDSAEVDRLIEAARAD